MSKPGSAAMYAVIGAGLAAGLIALSSATLGREITTIFELGPTA